MTHPSHAGTVTSGSEIRIRHQEVGTGDTCRRILETLPEWFGIPASVEDYVTIAEHSPSVIASRNGDDIGFVTLVSHSTSASEVYVMAVRPEFHRQGVGRQLLSVAEEKLARDGVEFLQVKTLAPSKPDLGYEKTRAFYSAYGFRPLEEFPDLWDAENPALQMIKVVSPR
jgi:GNAT superfamily N-acetyltransferase